MAEYTTLYKNIQSEHAEILRNLEKSERKIMDLSKDKLNYKAKIMEDGQLISDLSE
jgi:hypothetical protein